MTATPSGAPDGRAPDPKAAFVQRALAARLLAEQSVAELAHLPLGGLAVFLTWGEVSRTAQALWFAALMVATAVRVGVRRRAASTDLSRGIPVQLRAALIAVAAVWGVGMVLVAPHVPLLHAALLLLIICGLTAAATSTLLADPRSYIGYTGTLLILTSVAALRLATHQEFRIAFVIVVFYGAVMAMLYRRLRRVLLHSLLSEYEVGESHATIDRERRFLDQLFRSAPEAIVVLDEKHHLLRGNPAFERMFGYSVDEARERPLEDLILPTREVPGSEAFRARLETRATNQTEARRRRKDGTEFDVRISAVRLGTEEGNLLVLYDDISERKTAERLLRDSEARLFRTLASLPVGIMVIDPSGVPFFANDAAKQLLGEGIVAIDDVERLASTYRAYVAGTDDLYPSQRMPIVRALGGEETTVDDMEIRRPDSTIVLEVYGSPIRNAAGDVMFGVAAFTDITERRRIAEALEAARRAAEEATASKSAFLANMSHEIRTPLNGILGMAELLLDANLSSEERRSVELIMGSGETLLRVINDILDFSKIEAGQLDIEVTDIDLPVLVESTVRLLGSRGTASGIEMVVEIAPDVPTHVRGDPTRLRQVLTNLVGNAVKFTPRGEVVVRVERAIDEQKGSRLRFSVRDTGSGIPAEKLGSIFEAFRQADTTTTRRYGGTGLGLSISRRLVELMGGVLTVESTEGVGSVFSFTLDMPAAQTPQAVARPPQRLDGMRILVIDDNATNRRAMNGVLTAAGCIVEEAADGDEGLLKLRHGAESNSAYDAVVTDLLMPGRDGLEVAEAIRNDARVAATTIVLATSVNRRGDAERCRELGIEACLLKPTSREELLSALRGTTGTPASPALGTSTVAAPAAPSPVVPCRVLLAEDNSVNQEVASTLLRRRGHSVQVVGNGRAAVDAVATGTFDVVLMDLQMPEMDGIEATSRIRQLPEGSKVRIIALTANAMSGERERCLAAGMDGYVAKPFRSTDLLAAVENRASLEGPVNLTGTEQPVNLHRLRSDLELGGVVDIMDDILGAFTADAPTRLETLARAVEAGVPREIERAAHALKSGASTIHAGRLTELLQQMEREGRAGSTANAGRLLAEVDRALADVQQQLARERDQGAR